MKSAGEKAKGELGAAGFVGHVRQFVERMRYLMTQFSLGRWEDLSRWELVLVYPTILIMQVFRELIRDRGLVRASSLAYTTALSVVPMLTVATVLLSAFGVGEEALLNVLKSLLPVSGDRIAAQLSEFSHHQGGALTGVGSVVLIFLGVALFNNIEHAFNDVWRIRGRRPMVSKFLTFYALITLAPLMIAISVVESARVQFVMDELPFFASVGYKLLPLGLAMVAFTLANKLLPYTEVKWVPALISGVVTAVAFELAKAGFNYYATHFVMESYATVYGAISLIPIFLVWVYLTWVIVLFGAELTYTIQNLRYLLLPQRLHDINKNDQKRFNPLIGLEIFSPIAAAFKQSYGPIQLPRVAALAGVPLPLATDVIERLVLKRLVFAVEFVGTEGTSTGYIPARPLTDIRVIDVLLACREPVKNDELNPFIRSLFSLHQSREAALFSDMTCAALVDEHDPSRLRLVSDALAAEMRRSEDAPKRPRAFEDSLHRAGALMKASLDPKANAEVTKESPAQGPKASETGGVSPIDALAALGRPLETPDPEPQ